MLCELLCVFQFSLGFLLINWAILPFLINKWRAKLFASVSKKIKTNREKYVAVRLFRHQVYKSPEITGKSSPLFSCRHLDSRPNLFNRICLFERSLSAFTTPSWPHLRLRQSAIDSQHRHGHHTCCCHDHRPSPNTFQICSLGHWGMKPRANMSWKNPPTLCFWDTCPCRLLVAEAGQVSLSMQRVIQIQRYKLQHQPEKQVWNRISRWSIRFEDGSVHCLSRLSDSMATLPRHRRRLREKSSTLAGHNQATCFCTTEDPDCLLANQAISQPS
jgi:hypothetical protein